MVKQEQGIAMVLVVLIGAMVTLLSIILIDTVQSESNRSVQQVSSGTSFQAAEAGVEDYVSKMVDDRGYYLHYIHPGESTRREPGGTNVASGGVQTAWTYANSWSYPNGKDAWRALPNGYEYNLRVYPPGASSQYVRIVAAGRKSGSATDVRVIEMYVRPSSLADYYRVVNGPVSWGVGATTDGKIYANGTIDHDGTATGNIYSEAQITGSVSMQNGAQRYDVDSNPDIRSQIKTPINFTSFLASFTDIKSASQLPGGIYRNDTSWDAWRFTFNAGGTVGVQGCDRTGGNDVADVLPTCGATQTLPVPANGAIYSEQDAIVQGSVKGRVTIASNDDIVVSNNISFVTTGQDVLGLVAKNNLYVAKYVPDPFTWKAAVIAQTGTWQARPWTGALKSVMNFTGMAATDDGGSFAGMFTTRNYGYDDALLYLPPPWFPIVEDAYTVLFFRELPSGT
jgi:Tfp pilus assembly protein PilX